MTSIHKVLLISEPPSVQHREDESILYGSGRVQYFLDIATSDEFINYSIDALAQEAGFSSTHHLYKPFKKFHGGTPSDFIYFSSSSLSS